MQEIMGFSLGYFERLIIILALCYAFVSVVHFLVRNANEKIRDNG